MIKSSFLAGTAKGWRGIVSPVSLLSTFSREQVSISTSYNTGEGEEGGTDLHTHEQQLLHAGHGLSVPLERIWVCRPQTLVERLLKLLRRQVDELDRPGRENSELSLSLRRLCFLRAE